MAARGGAQIPSSTNARPTGSVSATRGDIRRHRAVDFRQWKMERDMGAKGQVAIVTG